MQKDALNCESEQLQGVNLHLKHPGAGLQGVWYHSVWLTEEGALTGKWETNPLPKHLGLPERGTARVPALYFFSVGRSFSFSLPHSVTICVFPLAHSRDSVLFSLLCSHLLSLRFVPSPEFVSVSACLSFSPGTHAGLDIRPSVTQRAEGTGLATHL